MKYSFMSFSTPGLTLQDSLSLAKNLGYTGFEPRIDSKHGHGIEPGLSKDAIAEVRSIVDASGIELCCLASSVKVASRGIHAAELDNARRVIDLCAALDIPRIRVFGGTIDEGCTRTEAIELAAEGLDILSDEIGDSDICLCFETHDDWCDPAHVAAVMQHTRGKHIGVNWDLMHGVLTAHADISESFGLLRPYIRHVHIHGGTRIGGLQFLPIEGNVIDHKKALAELMTIGYDGYLSGEWIGWDDPDYLPRELATMKQYEEELKCSK